MGVRNALRSNAGWWLAAGALCGLSLNAQAAKKFPDFMYDVLGPSTTIGTGSNGTPVIVRAPTNLTPGGGWVHGGGGAATYAAGPGPAGGTTIAGAGTVPVGGKNVPAEVRGQISKEDIAAAAIGCVGATIVGCAAVVGIPLALQWLANSGVRWSADAKTFEAKDPKACTMAPCYSYWASQFGAPQSTEARDPQMACEQGSAWTVANGGTYNRWVSPVGAGGGTSATCTMTNTYDSRRLTFTMSNRSVAPLSPTWYPTTPEAAKTQVVADTANNPPPGIVPELENAGVDWTGKMHSPTITGPAQIKGPETVTTKPDGSTTTKQETTPMTYSGPKATAGPTTTTQVDRNSTGQTTGTTTTTTTQPTEDGEAPPPKEDVPVQCDDDKYPDSLGCMEVGNPENEEIPKESKTITYTPESPFGGGSCPADKYFTSSLSGQAVKAVDWVQWCSYGTSYIRPLVLLLAAISAFFIVALGKDAE